MPTYIVTVEETIRHSVEIEADNPEEAGEQAIEAVVQSPDEAFYTGVEDRSVYLILEKKA